jgi:hypothetical protein
MLDFANEKIGFNGEYYNITHYNPKPFVDEAKIELVYVVIIAAGTLILLSLFICIWVARKNSKLRD